MRSISRSTAAIALKQNLSHQQRAVAEEIDGLIRVYQDGHVERPQVMPCVPPSLAPDLRVSRDTIIDDYADIWARVYVPNAAGESQLPLLLYFHGGGFCLGSPSWSCYHHFLAKIASQAGCAVVSVNYRLAPENPLPAAYDDGIRAVSWVRHQVFDQSSQWWAKKCDFSSIFLCGDSAGANIAYNVALRLARPLDSVKGLVLIQPFFGGERRTYSEKNAPSRSVLTLATADAYWRLALPEGADRDHPWCNPALPGGGVPERVMVCVSEMDILKDRNLEFCHSLAATGGACREVEEVVFKDVGHAFQVLNKSNLSEIRVHEMICRIKEFVTRQTNSLEL